MDEDVTFVVSEPPSIPWPLNHPKIGGSLPSTQLTSTPSIPRSFLLLAQTAPKASLICLNSTIAVPNFGGFCGAFFDGLTEKTSVLSSTAPNFEMRVNRAERSASSGWIDRVIFTFTVVSCLPAKFWSETLRVPVGGELPSGGATSSTWSASTFVASSSACFLNFSFSSLSFRPASLIRSASCSLSVASLSFPSLRFL